MDVSGSLYTGPGVLDTANPGWTSAPTTGNSFWLGGRQIFVTYGSHASGNADAVIDLFDNYKHNSSIGSFGVVLTNLDVNLTYDLVIYGAQNFSGGRGGSFDPVEPDLPAKTTTGDQQSSLAEGARTGVRSR